MSVEYIVVPDDDDEFDPQYVPSPDEDDETEEHPPIPEDLSDFE